jgi:hypothetical protein
VPRRVFFFKKSDFLSFFFGADFKKKNEVCLREHEKLLGSRYLWQTFGDRSSLLHLLGKDMSVLVFQPPQDDKRSGET